MKRRPSSTYSRYVMLMKVILPVSILLSIGLALGWPYLMSLGKESMAMVDVDHPEIKENRMVRPHYVSTDKKGQPFEINAEWAKQKSENLADLINPEGSMTVIEGDTFNVKADKGHYDSQNKVLTLKENVTLNSKDGYKFDTQEVHVNIDNKIIDGDHFIEGEGPTGKIRGEKGFTVETRPEGKKVLTLKGRSRVEINTVALKKKKESHAQ